jgi:hypothetical protein
MQIRKKIRAVAVRVIKLVIAGNGSLSSTGPASALDSPIDIAIALPKFSSAPKKLLQESQSLLRSTFLK